MSGERKIEGARAFNRGAERHTCPYAPGTIAFHDWIDGWAQQKSEFEQRLQHEHVAMSFRKAG
ncbi:hypothetical protein ASG43_21620 [Aureimonas sp. Leaf454]|uniref:Rmf/CrpP family protein n=1 Tax=Aureimonas sp. Leaf454 TaxID=1736381 RepID=UPI0007004D12|nr:Rmf/CrpP family protein [Aureimonas sp. Leaf454]KQT50278.1 hypothetical protein ASG43_21620 [Aureimonas sp. Leaf454]